MKLKNSFEKLNEVKLSRVYQHLKGDKPFGIITAFRGEYDLETNTKNNVELASTLKNVGFGYFWVDGAWIENKGTPQEQHVSEISIFVIGSENSDEKLFNVLREQSNKFNQDGFVFKPSGSDSKIAVYTKDGKKDIEFSDINMDKLADIYTKIRSGGHHGRTFVFEGERMPFGFFAKLRGLKDEK